MTAILSAHVNPTPIFCSHCSASLLLIRPQNNILPWGLLCSLLFQLPPRKLLGFLNSCFRPLPKCHLLQREFQQLPRPLPLKFSCFICCHRIYCPHDITCNNLLIVQFFPLECKLIQGKDFCIAQCWIPRAKTMFSKHLLNEQNQPK